MIRTIIPTMIRYNSKYPLSFFAGLGLIIIVVMLVVNASLFTKYDPLEQNTQERLQKISKQHLFGTDRFGRDVFSRTLYGGRLTLVSAFLALSLSLAAGLSIGLFCGMYKDSFVDMLFMRLIDILMSFPFMVLAMIVAALFGTGLLHLLSAIVSVWWVSFARLTRSVVLRIKTETYVSAAQVLGAHPVTVILRDILPRAISPVLIQATFELGNLILTISALSFLGLGAQPPTPEWGSMLSDGRAHFMSSPHILLGPAFFIFLTVLSLNLIGEGFRDRLDPYETARL